MHRSTTSLINSCQRPIVAAPHRQSLNARRSCIARVKDITSEAEFEQEVLQVRGQALRQHLLCMSVSDWPSRGACAGCVSNACRATAGTAGPES